MESVFEQRRNKLSGAARLLGDPHNPNIIPARSRFQIFLVIIQFSQFSFKTLILFLERGNIISAPRECLLHFFHGTFQRT
ncbi:hypothetical protein ABVT39_002885 [Epinephelus coioides]